MRRAADPARATTPARPLAAALLALVLGACARPTSPPATPLPGAPSTTAAAPVYRDEIRALTTQARVREAFRVVEELEPRTRRDLVALTQIPAPPFSEAARARRYAELFREAGADSVWIDDVGNVLGLRRGRAGGRLLVLSGHLDTVFPEGTDVTVRVSGDTLRAPGVGDDTRGLIVVLTVLRALEAAGLETEGDVLFVGTMGEEGLGDLRGVKHLFRDGGPPIAAFISISWRTSCCGGE